MAKVESKILNILQKELKQKYPSLISISVPPDIFIFEERIKLQCFHCKHYSKKWTCPGKMPDINYKKIFSEYENGLIIYGNFRFRTEEEFADIRTESTNLIHKAALYSEKILCDLNVSTAISFIGGSCKLCKRDCATAGCANPYHSRIPVEALGINLISSLKKIDIDIKFPVIDSFKRIGFILW